MFLFLLFSDLERRIRARRAGLFDLGSQTPTVRTIFLDNPAPSLIVEDWYVHTFCKTRLRLAKRRDDARLVMWCPNCAVEVAIEDESPVDRLEKAARNESGFYFRGARMSYVAQYIFCDVLK